MFVTFVKWKLLETESVMNDGFVRNEIKNVVFRHSICLVGLDFFTSCLQSH